MLFFTKSKKFIIIFFGIFCFIFSCLSFSSELSVKSTPSTQQSEPLVKETAEKEKESELPLLTDKEYNEILDSPTPPNYYNFKRVLEYMDINSKKEYLDFRKELEVENFPPSPKKYYGKEWEGWIKEHFKESRNSEKSVDLAVNEILELARDENSKKELTELNRDEEPKLDNKLLQKDKKTIKPKRTVRRVKKINWMTFKEARAFVQKAGIKTVAEFRKWIESGNKPPNFPSSPYSYYRRYWVSWYHFFGIERKSRSRTDWMEFEEARAFIQKKGIKKYREFYEWIKSEDRNPNVPSNPRVVYKKDWVSWRHFFGTEGKERHLKDWMSYEEARAFVQKAGIKTVAEFREWSKAGKKPPNIPTDPKTIYKEEWVSWFHFLGTDKRGNRKNWMSFAEAQAVIQKAGIKTFAEFREWSRAGHRPPDFPTNPQLVYKKDWKGWTYFLGTDKRGNRKNWMSFAEAQAIVQKAGIKTSKEFREWSKTKRPPNFPSAPNIKYKDWVSWRHFFGIEKCKKVFK